MVHDLHKWQQKYPEKIVLGSPLILNGGPQDPRTIGYEGKHRKLCSCIGWVYDVVPPRGLKHGHTAVRLFADNHKQNRFSLFIAQELYLQL